MRRIITTYFTVVLLLSLGFFGVGTLASAQQDATVDIDPATTPAVAGDRINGS